MATKSWSESGSLLKNLRRVWGCTDTVLVGVGHRSKLMGCGHDRRVWGYRDMLLKGVGIY